MNRPKNSYFVAGFPQIMYKVKDLAVDRYDFLAAFFIAPFILLSAYMLRGVYPFGQGSVLVLDLNAQYIYYFEYYRGIFLADNSLFYSFSRSLGGEMFGTYCLLPGQPLFLDPASFSQGPDHRSGFDNDFNKGGRCGAHLCRLSQGGQESPNTDSDSFFDHVWADFIQRNPNYESDVARWSNFFSADHFSR
jgi:hypothetical protein